MKKFSFPLESVMKYREVVQNQAEIELGKALSKESEIQSKIDEVALQNVTLRNEISGSLDFNDIVKAHEFYAFLGQEKDYLLEKMAEAKIVSEEKRKIAKEAMQKAESLHKLRERQFEEYKEKANAETFDEADDMTSARFGIK